MKSFSFFAQVGLAAWLLSGNAFAATVYRCGDSYSQTPCANGTVIQADDPRDDSQRAEAKTALSRDKALLKDIETTRRKDAAQEQAAPKKAPNKRKAKVKEEEEGVFTAAAPDLTPKKKPKKPTAKP